MEDHLAIPYAIFFNVLNGPSRLPNAVSCLAGFRTGALGRSLRNSIYSVIPLHILSSLINFISYNYIQKYSFLYN